MELGNKGHTVALVYNHAGIQSYISIKVSKVHLDLVGPAISGQDDELPTEPAEQHYWLHFASVLQQRLQEN